MNEPLAEPLVHDPRLAFPGIGKRVRRQDAALGDEPAGDGVPVVIGIDEATRGRQDSHRACGGHGKECEWTRKTTEHPAECKGRLRAC